MEESKPIYTLESSVSRLTVTDEDNYLTIEIKELSGDKLFACLDPKDVGELITRLTDWIND